MNRKKISILVLSFFLTFFLAYSHQGITRESFAHIEEQFMAATALYELQDYHEAFALWLSLAEQGDAESSFRISEMYYRGEGVAADKNEAVRWCLIAANRGHGKAQCTMGFRYTDHKAGPNPYVDSLLEGSKWLWLCCKHGDISETERNKAFSALNRHSCKLSDRQLEYAKIIAHEWSPTSNSDKSAHKSHQEIAPQEFAAENTQYSINDAEIKALDQFNLANSSYRGEGVEQDFATAAKLYRTVAEHGHPEAQVMMGFMFAEGTGFTRTTIKLLRWVKTSHWVFYAICRIWLSRSSSDHGFTLLQRAGCVSRLQEGCNMASRSIFAWL